MPNLTSSSEGVMDLHNTSSVGNFIILLILKMINLETHLEWDTYLSKISIFIISNHNQNVET